MEVIVLESKAFQVILQMLKEILAHLEKRNEDELLKDRWLDSNEVCELLKISKRTLYRYLEKGKISYSRVEQKIYFRSSDIERLLDGTLC